ncbi:MAG: hypothetical protein ACE5J9_02760 [Methanosarcinales archaeon]
MINKDIDIVNIYVSVIAIAVTFLVFCVPVAVLVGSLIGGDIGAYIGVGIGTIVGFGASLLVAVKIDKYLPTK